MEKVLQWSIAQASEDPAERAKAPALDATELAKVLGAQVKDDAQMMKEDIALFLSTHPDVKVDDRIMALEDFEALIMNLDNANNISNLGLWNQIVQLLTYDGEEKEEIQGLAAQIIGTAVQNNVKSQMDFHKEVGVEGFKKLFELLKGDSNLIKAKVIYALSGLVAHNGPNYSLFDRLDGWQAVSDNLKVSYDAKSKPSSKVLLRLLNLIKSLLYDEILEEGKEELIAKSTKVNKFDQLGVVDDIIAKLDVDGNIEINDRVLDVLNFLKTFGYQFSKDQSESLLKKLTELKPVKDSLNIDLYNNLL